MVVKDCTYSNKNKFLFANKIRNEERQSKPFNYNSNNWKQGMQIEDSVSQKLNWSHSNQP